MRPNLIFLGRLLVAALLVSFVVGGVVSAQGPYQRFENILTKKLLVTDASTFRGDMTFSGTGSDLTVTGNLKVGNGTPTVTQNGEDAYVEGSFEADGPARFDSTITQGDGDTIVADKLKVVAQTAITVTNGAAFTATGTYQPIQAASTVTPTITAGTAGQALVLINTSAQSIVIVDTGNQVLASTVTLGQYDTLTLWADGTRWVEISRSNN